MNVFARYKARKGMAHVSIEAFVRIKAKKTGPLFPNDAFAG